MFSLARITLPSPVTLTLPTNRPRIIGGASTPIPPGQGSERDIVGFDACFTINPVTRTIHAELPPLPRALLLYAAADFAAACADTPEQHAGRVLEVLGSEPQSYLQALIDGTELPSLPQRVPREIAHWRIAWILESSGKLADVESLISTLPEDVRGVSSAAWTGKADLNRHSPLVLAAAELLGYSPADLDTLFIAAAAIPG